MSFRILFLPSLVHDITFGQMSLKEIFLLSTISKRMRRVLRSSFATQSIELFVNSDKNMFLHKILDHSEFYEYDETDEFAMLLEDMNQLGEEKPGDFVRYELHNFLGCDTVPVFERVGGRLYSKNEKRIYTYWTDKAMIFNSAIEHFAQVFPKLKAILEYGVSSSQEFSETLQILRNYNVALRGVEVGTSNETDDEMMKLLLDKCRKTPYLSARENTSPDFQYDFGDGDPLGGFEIHLQAGNWLTVDHFVNQFMNYNKVILYDSRFTFRELRTIFTEWIDDSTMQEFLMEYKWNTLAPIFKNMEGAVPLAKAKVKELYFGEMQGYWFDRGEAYLLTQTDGTMAIVYRSHKCLYMVTEFQLEGDEGEDENRWPFVENDYCFFTSEKGEDDVHVDTDEDDDDEDEKDKVEEKDDDEKADDEEEEDNNTEDEA